MNLDNPSVFRLFQSALGSHRCAQVLVRRYVRPALGCRVLDVGCGAGGIISYLPDIRYTGVDLNPQAILRAQGRFGAKARFVCANVFDFLGRDADQYDLVIAIGLLHHLDDRAAGDLFFKLKERMSTNSRMITLDGCYEGRQSFVERWLLDNDRGKFVRKPDGYLALARPSFKDIRIHLEKGPLRVPYTHCIMEMTKDRS